MMFTMKYYAFVYGIYFYGDTHKEVQYAVEDYVQDVLSGPVERYTIREWKLAPTMASSCQS